MSRKKSKTTYKKLTDAQVKQLRKAYLKGVEPGFLATEYGVSRQAVAKLIKNTSRFDPGFQKQLDAAAGVTVTTAPPVPATPPTPSPEPLTPAATACGCYRTHVGEDLVGFALCDEHHTEKAYNELFESLAEGYGDPKKKEEAPKELPLNTEFGAEETTPQPQERWADGHEHVALVDFSEDDLKLILKGLAKTHCKNVDEYLKGAVRQYTKALLQGRIVADFGSKPKRVSFRG